MQLSEAVLLGLPEIEFTNGNWFTRPAYGKCKGCLVGASLLAATDTNGRNAVPEFHREWPWTGQPSRYRCPVCDVALEVSEEFGFCSMFTHIASHYIAKEITGEQIADY